MAKINEKNFAEMLRMIWAIPLDLSIKNRRLNEFMYALCVLRLRFKSLGGWQMKPRFRKEYMNTLINFRDNYKDVIEYMFIDIKDVDMERFETLLAKERTRMEKDGINKI